MPLRTGPGDRNVIKLTRELKKKSNEQKVEIWRVISRLISRPRRVRAEINLSAINRNTKARDVVVVPGKVLASGEIDHEVSVAALSFSEAARQKIEKAHGKVMTIPELTSKNPKGTNVKIME
jgi:large subunit ribosomal protein L18e